MPKTILPLTLAAIQKVVTDTKRERRVDLRDGAVPGLRLRVNQNRQKWELVSSHRGKRVTVSLGSYPEVGLAQARKAATERRDAFQTAATALIGIPHAPTTLEELIDLYGAQRGPSMRSWADQERSIRRVYAGLLAFPLVKLDGATVQRVADAYPSGSVSAHSMRALRPLLKWGRKRGFVLFNPGELEQPTHNREPRRRVLSDEELSAVLPALDVGPYDNAVRLMLLTACRKSEVTEARWDEFNLDAGLWIIPGVRMKNGQTHVVPLPADAVDLLRAMPRTGDRVFGIKMVNWGRFQEQINHRSKTCGWHRHDLRRTAATILGRLGEAPHVIEMVLAHAHPLSRLNSTYNTNRYLPEHRDALEKLAAHYKKLQE
jgi:integrase